MTPVRPWWHKGRLWFIFCSKPFQTFPLQRQLPQRQAMMNSKFKNLACAIR